MKAAKTLISVYPVWYRILVFLIIPITVIAIGSVLLIFSENISGFDLGAIISMSFLAMLYAEIFGEWFTIGEICTRKGAFGDIVLSSPAGRRFVKDFATADVLRKIIGYPLIFLVQQLIVLIVRPDRADIPEGIFIGFIFAVSVIVGVWIIRKTKSIGLRFLSVLATNTLSGLLGVPFLFSSNPAVKMVIGSVSAVLAVLFAYLSSRSVIRSSKEDYYDE